MSFSQFMTILRARWILLVSVFLITVVSVVVGSLLFPKKYTATASVVIDSKSPDPISGFSMQGAMLSGYIATQIDVITSERVARRVIERLRLNQVPLLREQWQEEADGVGSFESWLADALVQSLEIKPARDSSVINVSYKGADPAFSAALANAFVESYIETTLELRVEPARQFSRLFEEQSKQARAKLEETQSKLSAFQKEKGLINADERLDVETMKLNELSAQLIALQTQTADAQSRKAQAGPNSAEVFTSPVVVSLRGEISRSEARLQELSAKMGSAHPQVRELQASIAELRARLDQETRNATASVGITSTINAQREAQIRAALENQRQKVLRLKEQRDEAMVLVRDVENAQLAYANLQQRYSQLSLESNSNQTNVSVLRVASPPSEPSSPWMLLNTLLGIVLGLLLGLAAAVGVELMDRRVRSEIDVEELESPFLGTLPKVDHDGRPPVKASSLSLPRMKKAPALGAPAA